MGLFGNRAAKIQTAEEKYFAAQADAREAEARRKRDQPAPLPEPSTPRKAKVSKVGTLTRDTRGRLTADGWSFEGDPNAYAPLTPGKTTRVAGHTLKDLCRMAHGPHCRLRC